MMLYIQRPYLSIHSSYRCGVGNMRAYRSGSMITVELWATHDPEYGIEKGMTNGV